MIAGGGKDSSDSCKCGLRRHPGRGIVWWSQSRSLRGGAVALICLVGPSAGDASWEATASHAHLPVARKHVSMVWRRRLAQSQLRPSFRANHLQSRSHGGRRHPFLTNISGFSGLYQPITHLSQSIVCLANGTTTYFYLFKGSVSHPPLSPTDLCAVGLYSAWYSI